MFQTLFETLVELCADSTSSLRGARAVDLHKAMKAKGYAMNDSAFGAILFEWDRFERQNGQRVTFHNSTSSRGKTYGYNLGAGWPFQTGAITIRE